MTWASFGLVAAAVAALATLGDAILQRREKAALLERLKERAFELSYATKPRSVVQLGVSIALSAGQRVVGSGRLPSKLFRSAVYSLVVAVAVVLWPYLWLNQLPQARHIPPLGALALFVAWAHLVSLAVFLHVLRRYRASANWADLLLMSIGGLCVVLMVNTWSCCLYASSDWTVGLMRAAEPEAFSTPPRANSGSCEAYCEQRSETRLVLEREVERTARELRDRLPLAEAEPPATSQRDAPPTELLPDVDGDVNGVAPIEASTGESAFEAPIFDESSASTLGWAASFLSVPLAATLPFAVFAATMFALVFLQLVYSTYFLLQKRLLVVAVESGDSDVTRFSPFKPLALALTLVAALVKAIAEFVS